MKADFGLQSYLKVSAPMDIQEGVPSTRSNLIDAGPNATTALPLISSPPRHVKPRAVSSPELGGRTPLYDSTDDVNTTQMPMLAMHPHHPGTGPIPPSLGSSSKTRAQRLRHYVLTNLTSPLPAKPTNRRHAAYSMRLSPHREASRGMYRLECVPRPVVRLILSIC
jgi:hypothetical protein